MLEDKETKKINAEEMNGIVSEIARLLEMDVGDMNTKYFKGEFKHMPELFKAFDAPSLKSFAVFAKIFCCFSNDTTYNLKNRNQQPEQTPIAQKACQELAKFIKKVELGTGFSQLLPFANKNFDKSKINENPELMRHFCQMTEKRGETIIEALYRFNNLKDEKCTQINEGVFETVVLHFDKVFGSRDKYAKTTWEQHFLKHHRALHFDSCITEDEKNKDIVAAFRELTVTTGNAPPNKSRIDTIAELRETAIKKNLQDHILGKPLFEEFEINKGFDNGQQLENAFYEFLPKTSAENFTTQSFVGSCAGFFSHYVQGVMKHKNIQTLVVRDPAGIIIAKATFCLVPESSAVVVNSIEIAPRYRKDAQSTTDYKEDHPWHGKNSQEREVIFTALMRGFNDFIVEYNQKPQQTESVKTKLANFMRVGGSKLSCTTLNPTMKTIDYMVIGTNFNRLKYLVNQHFPESEKYLTNVISPPNEYDFPDATGGQRVMFDKSHNNFIKQALDKYSKKKHLASQGGKTGMRLALTRLLGYR